VPVRTYFQGGPSQSGIDTTNASQDLAAKHARALLDGIHQEIDLEGLTSLTALAGTETQAQTDTFLEALRTACLAHGAGVGTATVDGEHLAADTANNATLAAIPACNNTLARSIALVNGLHAWDVAHATSVGVHFHDDAAEAADTITTDPPTTLAHVRTDGNDVRQSLLNHFSIGQPDTVADIGKLVAGTGVTVTGGGKLANGDVTVAAAWAAGDAAEAAARDAADTAAIATAEAFAAARPILIASFTYQDLGANVPDTALSQYSFASRPAQRKMINAGHVIALVWDGGTGLGVVAGTVTFTVFKNGVATAAAITGTIGQINLNWTGSVAYAAGDLLSVHVTTGAGSTIASGDVAMYGDGI
jgi:hypothetical protein